MEKKVCPRCGHDDVREDGTHDWMTCGPHLLDELAIARAKVTIVEVDRDLQLIRADQADHKLAELQNALQETAEIQEENISKMEMIVRRCAQADILLRRASPFIKTLASQADGDGALKELHERIITYFEE